MESILNSPPEPPPPDLPPSVPRRHGDGGDDGDANGGRIAAGPLGDRLIMSDSDRERLHADIYGRPSPQREELEHKLASVKEELAHIPAEERGALEEALRRNPLLVETSVQVLGLRAIDNGEGGGGGVEFDPRLAARRLARYWKQREAVFGHGAFADGVFRAPDEYDLMRHYERAAEAAANFRSSPDADGGHESNGDDDEDQGTTKTAISQECIDSVRRYKIAAFDRVLEATPPSEKVAFVAARQEAISSGVEFMSDHHKLMFLKAEDFVEDRAVKRMLLYWTTKMDLFGVGADIADGRGDTPLCRDVTVEDLDGGAAELQRGLCRLMPGQDESGRAVFVLSMEQICEGGRTGRMAVQAIWYVLQEAIRNEATRAHGVVILADGTSLSRDTYNRSSDRRAYVRRVLFEAAPVKVRAIHASLPDMSWAAGAFAKLVSAVGSAVTSRVVVHTATREEFTADLESFGIASDQVPSEMGGNVTPEYWRSWIDERSNDALTRAL